VEFETLAKCDTGTMRQAPEIARNLQIALADFLVGQAMHLFCSKHLGLLWFKFQQALLEYTPNCLFSTGTADGGRMVGNGRFPANCSHSKLTKNADRFFILVVGGIYKFDVF
jgi:hypothetical protein